MLFKGVELTFKVAEHTFKAVEHRFTVRKHKKHFVAETFGGLNGKKCRTERKEK